jgi:hypothetical protein
MSVEELKIAYNYFKNKIGRRRVSAYVAEMRRVIAMQMIQDGAHPNHVAEILQVDRASAYHYAEAKPARKDVEESVQKYMYEWMEKGMIPKSIQLAGIGPSYVLVSDADQLPRKKNSAIVNKYDIILKEICE